MYIPTQPRVIANSKYITNLPQGKFTLAMVKVPYSDTQTFDWCKKEHLPTDIVRLDGFHDIIICQELVNEVINTIT